MQRANEVLRAQTIQAKKLAEEKKKLEEGNINLTKSLRETIGEYSKATVGLAALGAGVYKAGQYFSDLIEAGVKWEDTVGHLGPQTKKLADNIGNLISETDLFKLVEYQEELGLTEKQTNAITQASIHYARVSGKEFKATFDEVVNAVISGGRGGSDVLRKMGIGIDAISGSKTERMNSILSILSARFGDLTTSAENASEAHDAYNNKLADTQGRVGAQITQSELYKKAIEGINSAKVKLIEYTGDVLDQYQYLGKEIQRIYTWLREAEVRIVDFVTRSQNYLTILRAKALESEVRDLKRSSSEYDKILSETRNMLGKHQAELAAYEINEEAKKKKRQKVKKDDFVKGLAVQYDAHIKLYRELEKAEVKRLSAIKKADDNYYRAKNAWQNQQRNKERQMHYEALARDAKLAEKRKKELEDTKQKAGEYTGAFLDVMAANISASSSFEQFSQRMVASGIGALASIAGKKAIFYAGEALASAAMFNFPSAAKFTAAAAVMGGISVGGSVASSSVGSYGSGGGSMSSAPSPYSQQNLSSVSTLAGRGSSSESSGGGGSPVVNINMRSNRTIGVTKKDLANEWKRTMAGV